MRKRNLGKLSKLGFKVSKGLPVTRDGRLRPLEEIAARLMALQVVFLWVRYSEDELPSKKLKAYAKKSSLSKWLTKEERRIFAATREKAYKDHADTIGWRLENMWPLAWILGYRVAPPCDGKMITDKTISGILFSFLPAPNEGLKELLAAAKARKEDAVAELEDLFYCCHNAVRSAQLGGKTVPKRFDPVVNGGVIHERRHSLTWALSPGIKWDDTDLST